MIQLQTSDLNKINRSLVLPYVGEVVVPGSGIIEIPSQELAALIVEANVGFELFEGSFETIGEDLQNVAATILENNNLKEENLKLSLQVASLKKENQTLLINQKPISVIEQSKAVNSTIVEQPKVIVSTVKEEIKPIVVAGKPIEKKQSADFSAKIAAIEAK